MTAGRTRTLSALVLLGIIVVGGWGALSDKGAPLRGISISPLLSASPPQSVSPPPSVSPPQSTEPDPLVARTLVAVAPETPPLQARWTSDWANARAEPRADALILEELPPGTRIDGFRHPTGWWLVYIYGDSVGYVAGALLRPTPPDTTGVMP